MVEYCVYWLENGEPMHEVFSSLAAAEMYSCAIRGKGLYMDYLRALRGFNLKLEKIASLLLPGVKLSSYVARHKWEYYKNSTVYI